MSRFGFCVSSALLLVLAGCNQANEYELVLTGSSTIAPVMADLAAIYEAKHPGWRIDVQSGGSSRGIHDARQMLADAGMVSRELTEDEQDLTAHRLAYDGIVLIVNAGNPVQSLTDAEIRRIYRGDITDWSIVGGRELQITVINKSAGRATLEVFLDYFELDNRDIQPHLVAGENQQVIQAVTSDRAAVGYVSIGTAEYEAQNGAAIKLLPLAKQRATTVNVRTGKYPMSRPLNVITRGAPDPELEAFMEFWQTPAAADIIRQHHFVPATP